MTITVAFAVYAVAVAISLVLAGHLSDVYGRRRLLVPALALNVVAGLVFVTWPALPGLLVARVLSGLGRGCGDGHRDGVAGGTRSRARGRVPAASERTSSVPRRTSAGSASAG